MKESHFVRSNKEKWERFEAMQGSNNSDPEELSNLYLDITDDLGFAQTYYQRRSIRIYLNQLAQKVLIGVNRYQKQSFKSFLNFWTVDLPIEIYKARSSLRFAFLCFLGYAVLGWISSEIYPEFIASILGQDYVDLTVKNIEKGNPLAIYEGSTQMQ
ncbi:MAG: stage II sporulation protein M, partial [Flavobacteriia bacterium]|nr:stage II sporulation protein M [Flavobacteriia bacterium]